MCALLQIVAMGCGTMFSELDVMGLLYDVFNGIGMILFAIITMGIYTPIFSTLKEGSSTKEISSTVKREPVERPVVPKEPVVYTSVNLNDTE